MKVCLNCLLFVLQLLQKQSLNSDGQQLHQYQQNARPSHILNH